MPRRVAYECPGVHFPSMGCMCAQCVSMCPGSHRCSTWAAALHRAVHFILAAARRCCVVVSGCAFCEQPQSGAPHHTTLSWAQRTLALRQRRPSGTHQQRPACKPLGTCAPTPVAPTALALSLPSSHHLVMWRIILCRACCLLACVRAC